MSTTAAAPLSIPAGMAVCPKCDGSTRRPYDYTHDHKGQYRKVMATYRESDDTLACNNCGGQSMSMKAIGFTHINPATGLGCLHQFRGENAGRCYTVYTCTLGCGARYDIDSGD